MSAVQIPLRSALFVPGIQARMLEKARDSQADAIWVDLEDAVPADKREEARRLAREALPHYRQATFVRVNALATLLTWDDLMAVVSPALTGILLPKTASAGDVALIEYLLSCAEQRNGCTVGSISLIVTIESVEGLGNCREIFNTSSKRLVGASVGTARKGDLQRSLGYEWSEGGMETLYVRSKVLAEAKLARLPIIIEGPYVNHQDFEGLRRECRRARQFGYNGKAAIHPGQVDVINEAFSPSEEELDYYRRLVTEMEAAYARGVAAITFEHELADTAMYLLAKEVLAQASTRQQVGDARKEDE